MKRVFSFAAGMLLALLIVAGSVAVPALQPDRFEKAVLNTVKPEAVGMSESDLAAFALETMAYLRGEKADWQPVTPFAIPQSFVVHMAEVRGWVDVLKWALPAGVMIALLCLWLGRNVRMVRAGMLSVLGLMAALLLWAAVDFESLWMVIHRVLIPGGIFPAGEPVMQLFPLNLFFGYIPAVLCWMAGWLAVLYAGIKLLINKYAA